MISDLRNKLSVFDAEIAKLKYKNVKTLKANGKYNERYDTENVKLKVRIEKLKSENIEFKDRLMKVKQNQLQNNSKGNNTSNNNSSNFNLNADYYEKLLKEKEMDKFLNEVDKKSISDRIKQCNKKKKL